MNPRHLLAVIGLLALGGCTTTAQQCDSTLKDPSLITKMSCDLGGGYQQQVDQKQQALSDARSENAAFRQVYDTLVAQQQATGHSLAEQQRQEQTLQSSMNNLLAQLKTRHANKASVQTQVADLQRQLTTAKTPVATATPAQVEARQQELKTLQQKVSRLQMSLGYE